jgi:hypothetical protein
VEWAEKMAALLEEAQAIKAELTSLGGASHEDVTGYFLDETGEARTDLSVNHAEFVAVHTTANALNGSMASGHGTNIYAALQRRGVPR